MYVTPSIPSIALYPSFAKNSLILSLLEIALNALPTMLLSALCCAVFALSNLVRISSIPSVELNPKEPTTASMFDTSVTSNTTKSFIASLVMSPFIVSASPAVVSTFSSSLTLPSSMFSFIETSLSRIS